MPNKLLSKHFLGVAAKRLSAVEADFFRSNQHEFNVTTKLKALMGEPDRKNIPTTFIWLDDERHPIREDAFLSWYDARRNKRPRSEYRFYFPDNSIMDMVTEGDAVFFAIKQNGSIMVIVTPAMTTTEQQVAWLFGVDTQLGEGYALQQFSSVAGERNSFAAGYILEALGIDSIESQTDSISLITSRFGHKFPGTKEFSNFARETLPDVNANDNPDQVLMAWMEQEEVLFKSLERHLLKDRIEKGFMIDGEVDVDSFVKFSLSVQNRRKSRVGYAFENHLEAIFQDRGIQYDRGKITENRAKPDFIFPSITKYHDSSFSVENLTMLGVKTTCKDRWRQVLSEAARIDDKHLITLEPGISENQTDEMQDMNLQLVLPSPLHETFKKPQQEWLMSVSDFIDLIQIRQVIAQ